MRVVSSPFSWKNIGGWSGKIYDLGPQTESFRELFHILAFFNGRQCVSLDWRTLVGWPWATNLWGVKGKGWSLIASWANNHKHCHSCSGANVHSIWNWVLKEYKCGGSHQQQDCWSDAHNGQWPCTWLFEPRIMVENHVKYVICNALTCVQYA